jgi:hypothetical protein
MLFAKEGNINFFLTNVTDTVSFKKHCGHLAEFRSDMRTVLTCAFHFAYVFLKFRVDVNMIRAVGMFENSKAVTSPPPRPFQPAVPTGCNDASGAVNRTTLIFYNVLSLKEF